MRGSLAAVCAAVLVGISPAGALPFARLAAAVSCQSREAAAQRQAAVGQRAEPSAEAGRHARPASAGRRTFAADHRAIWRAPSGPAPSRAPPAA